MSDPRSPLRPSEASRRDLRIAIGATLFCLSFVLLSLPAAGEGELPWRTAGLTERQAAAHLLDRLTFGARPGDVDRLVAIGLEDWLDAQLAAALTEPRLELRLRPLSTLGLPAEQAAERFPPPGVVLREAVESGVLSEVELAELQSGPRPDSGEMPEDAAAGELRRRVVEFSVSRGYDSQRRLVGEAMAAKLVRAVYAENQLVEVLTDFWFNHFNVSITDNQARVFVPSFEAQAIRPHVLGRFRDMLGATARHPAMLLYLDNARSTATVDAPTTISRRLDERFGSRPRRRAIDRQRERERRRPNRSTGLNENYARELLELHTLGVDGGYTQEDVVEVARAFTGWTLVPPPMLLGSDERRLERALAARVGFEREGAFLFRADVHDEGRKVILGTTFPAGRGVEEGEAVLDLVASHPATERHLATKLAVRFVSDDPPEALVGRVAVALERTDGDLAHAVETLVYSPEFWAPEARRQKIKSPFELVVSSYRALGAAIRDPRSTIEWLGRLGQPLYAYQAPTGYPDRAEFWVNTGALLNRMNFGLELAAGALEGVAVDLAGLVDHREPESPAEALATYARLLLPERDLEETVARLEPMLRDPELAARLESAADGSAVTPSDPFGGEVSPLGEEQAMAPFWRRESRWEGERRGSTPGEPPTPIEQVVGLILGSPEFQRR